MIDLSCLTKFLTESDGPERALNLSNFCDEIHKLQLIMKFNEKCAKLMRGELVQFQYTPLVIVLSGLTRIYKYEQISFH
ncbi:hypothetical protein DMB44_05940 [Thermoplasma sp. Kam2015]|nr:hypothetical protein DMB44_05940 [Thermoplasma sp. Kam2015]